MRLVDADKIFQKVKGSTASKEVKCLAEVLVSVAPTVDAVVVTRCKDCKHSWEDIGGLCCSHGACVDLTVPGDFYCAYGERKP